MPILITGAAGFIGSHLAEKLLRESQEKLVGIDNFNDYYDPRLKRANAAALANEPRFTLIEGDFTNTELVTSIMRQHGIDHIVHLGAYAGVRYSVERPHIYQQANVGGTLSLLEAAQQVPVRRFLLISSSTVYGLGAAVPFREDSPLGIPASPYGATKHAAELMGLTYHQLHGVPTVCLRPFSVYGPRLRPDLALTIFVRAIVSGQSFPLFGDGSIRRDFTHVSDICDGLTAALGADGVVGECFNLGHSEPIEMRELIQRLEQCLGRAAKIDRRPAHPEDLPITYADLSKSKQLLQYEPKMPIDAGLQEFCDWYRRWHQA